MKRLLALTLVALAPSDQCAHEKPAVTPNVVRLNGHEFTLPEGFEIELVAGPPLVDRPVSASFDDQGRLYVTISSGNNARGPQQAQEKTHHVVRLEDTKGTGVFDKATLFADKISMPEGALWYNGSLYVTAPPVIWKFTDTKGAGTADKREIWHDGKTVTGCMNDLHGPWLGPDGWIYWTKGAWATQSYTVHGKKWESRASHVFRARPDGSGIEPVMTGGMDNPVGLAFTPTGELIVSGTFFQFPAYGKRDGLIHAVHGGIYGKDHDPIHDPIHKWTGPQVMPIMTHLGPAAACAITRYESEVFGQEYKDNLFVCQFNMRKVSRHILEPDGATFKTKDSDFLVSNNHDFHPTDVLEDADGSLLVVDTGGWYKICCPTSQLVKPDVLGGIYRIRRKGAAKVDDPRGLKIDWKKLGADEGANLLTDSRPVVRRRALTAMCAKDLDVLNGLILGNDSVDIRRESVWAAASLDRGDVRLWVNGALHDSDDSVRLAALHTVSLWRNKPSSAKLLNLLKDPSAQNRRAAAEALGRIGDRASVPALLEATGEKADRFLEHALTHALIEIGDPDATAAGLKSGSPLTRRAALIALDQMDGGKLDVKTVAADLNSTDPHLKEAAVWIVGRHPEWGADLAYYLRGRLAVKDLAAADRDELIGLLARFAGSAPVQELLVTSLRDGTKSPEACHTALRAIAKAALKTTPEPWLAAVTHLLSSPDADLVRESVNTARVLPMPKQRPEKLVEALLRIGTDGKAPEMVRLSALSAIPGGVSNLEPELFAFLIERLDKEQSVPTRSFAADILSRAKLDIAQLVALAAALKTTGPMEVNRLLDAFTQTTDEKVGLALLENLNQPATRSALRSESVRQRLEKYSPAVKAEAEKLYAALDGDQTKQRAKLEEMMPLLKDGDVRRGQAVFNMPKLACASCHTIGYVGGKIGPDLTRIGKVRSERDLLESILFPSASFVRSYEPVLVYTTKGKAFNGVLKKDAPDEVILTLNATDEVRIAREDIDSMRPGTVSIMPAGLDQQLTPRELADLVVFLKACQ
jgi:putative membrane-bound dehydrogenase-like protein